MTTLQEARDYIKQADKLDWEALENAIKTKWNCQDVDVYENGDVWIAVPMIGHTISEDHLIETVNWLKAAA